ncbi:ATP-binding cassette domain-containing protein [Nocardia brasiliensis]|uniref:Trehalose import ATP-binding protein SugC n=1 Tax=Nocardia brasiliensis TaxID=37326 RepID=A0A6G9XP51_NOCBR|nr:ABC transporter ATP-binding protein [Nocardia brasiliensis]QIS02688.1 ATP-binding cassette domain-containing protein [Nocardia brasiliensis]
MARIELVELTKEFPGGVRALDGLSCTIHDGEFFALLGPSGCGKTTLLRTIAGLETPTSGRIRIGERDVTRLAPGRRDVAMVFQDYALFPHMSVADNIAYPLKVRGTDRRTRAGKASETADQLSLQGLLARRPAELSGGQQQRVALARAMACHPQVFLFDEPLSNLDARLRLEARTFLKKLQLELGVTTVFVTHDQAEALALADRIAVLSAGRIRQLGTAREVFRRPADTFVANFIGSTPMNLIPGELVGLSPAVIWGARPEYLGFSDTAVPGALPGEVSTVQHLGATSLVTLAADGYTVGVTVPEAQEPELGSAGWVVPQADRVLLYDAESGRLLS